jgi:hypothetical protein
MFWVTDTLQRGVTYGTVTAYITAVKHVLRLKGIDVAVIDNMHLLKQLMQAAKKVHSRPTKARLPITTDILTQLRPHVLNVKHNGRMLWAAFTLAVAAMLRCGEFTVNHHTNEYMPLSALKWHSDQQGFTLTLARDKIHDTTVPIEVHMTGGQICPVKAMRAYLQHRTPSRHVSPLFVMDERQVLPLTRRYVTEQLPILCTAAGIEHAKDYKGHSFRRGGATSLARAGVQWHTIKQMGRWKSNAYQLYIDHSHTQLKEAATKAATHKQSYHMGKNAHDSVPKRSRKR